MSKEEKAREYAKSVVDESVENYIGEEIFDSHIEYASQCYIAGYTQAEQDLSSQLSEYKEALIEIINEATTIVIPASRFANNSEYVEYIDIDDFENLINKAKTLIE